jgi:Sulfotransferase family
MAWRTDNLSVALAPLKRSFSPRLVAKPNWVEPTPGECNGEALVSFSYAVSRILDAYPALDPKLVKDQLEYGSYASVKDRFIYIEVYKAASTTMRILLRELYASAEQKLVPDFNGDTLSSIYASVPWTRDCVSLPPITALEDKDQRELLEAPDVLRFTIVRNPYTRLVSAWRNKVFLCAPWIDDVYGAVRGEAPPSGQQYPVEFAEFVSYLESTVGRVWDAHWRRQVDLTFPKSLSFTHIGKVEILQETIRILARQLKYGLHMQLPHINEVIITPSPKYSAALAARVYALYEEDFANFGYDAQSWPQDREDKPCLVSESCFLDYVMARNLFITRLNRECARLRQEYDAVYRFSLARVQNKLRAIIRPGQARRI